MKILVAIQSSENPKTLARSTLRWAARAGYNMRIFIPDKSQLADYQQAAKDANHNWYLDLPETVVEVGVDPKDYAKKEGYDLLLYLPDDMFKWDPKVNHDLNVLEYAADVGQARLGFSEDTSLKEYIFENGIKMIRL